MSTEPIQSKSLPVPPRPLRLATNAELDYERKVRRGPRWRCSGCGWYCPEIRYQPRVPACPVCAAAGRTDTFAQVFAGQLGDGAMAGRDRDWLLAVAARCGLAWGDDPAAPPDAAECPHCKAPVRSHYPEMFACGTLVRHHHRTALCYERQIGTLTAQIPPPDTASHE